MKPLTEVLTDFNEARDKYESLKLSLVSDQSELLRTFTICYSLLSDHRIEAKNKWNSVQYHSTAKSQSGKDREADMSVPELYQLRHIMTANKLLIDAIRSTISVNRN